MGSRTDTADRAARFHRQDGGGFVRWTAAFDPDKVVDAFGNMPGEMIDYGAKALKPVENYVGNYLKLWDNIERSPRWSSPGMR